MVYWRGSDQIFSIAPAFMQKYTFIWKNSNLRDIPKAIIAQLKWTLHIISISSAIPVQPSYQDSHPNTDLSMPGVDHEILI